MKLLWRNYDGTCSRQVVKKCWAYVARTIGEMLLCAYTVGDCDQQPQIFHLVFTFSTPQKMPHFHQIPPSLQGASSEQTSSRFCAAGTKNKQLNNHGEVSPCGTAAADGLCACRVVLRAGVSLPLSIPEPPQGDDHPESGGNNGSRHNVASASSRSRWLVQVKATGGELTLSLLRPSRARTPSGGLDVQSPALGTTVSSTSNGTGTCRGTRQPKHVLRQPRSLVATWEDWAKLGYGPLQWMSHAQKALIARLSLYWVSLKPPTEKEPCLEGRAYAYMPTKTFRFPEEAFLRLRPILYCLRRVVGTPRETLASVRCGGDSARRSMSASSESGDRESLRAVEVFVRDEGSVLRVEVETGGEGGVGPSQQGVERLERTFGKEVWQETGLGELLWSDCSDRQYLARRLAQQVR